MDGGSQHCIGVNNKNYPQEKEMKEGKVIEEDLQIVEKRREAKGRAERERYTQLKAEFQKIAKREKKVFQVISANK